MSLCDYLLRLYRGSRECGVARLPDWALEHTCSLVPFDSAIWAIATDTADMHGIHSFRLPVEFINLWKKTNSDKDVPTGGGNGRAKIYTGLLSRMKDAPKKDALPLPKLCKRFGIQHAICTSVEDPFSGLHHSFSFYRHDTDKPFGCEDRMLAEFCAPHLVEARNNNIAAHAASRKQTDCPSAVCDRRGKLYHTDPGFIEMLKIEWPEFSPPYAVSGVLLSRLKKCSVFEGKNIVIMASGLGDLVRLQVRHQGRVCRLSSRERLITKHLVAGSTYKQIAQALDISPFTVTKHANSIYKKTGAHNKTQLAKKFQQMKEVNTAHAHANASGGSLSAN